MKYTRVIMGMPITIEIIDTTVTEADFDNIFSFFISIDERFSTYKQTSEISQINSGKLREPEYSAEMNTILALSEETKRMTDGYFDIRQPNGVLDPSGLVKGWAIYQAANMLSKKDFTNFYVDAGGDIEARGHNADGQPWIVGIRHPFVQNEIVKVLSVQNRGVATSGSYLRGQHIYNPHQNDQPIDDIVSMTVVGPNIYDADRFATAAFAMGKKGIAFIEQRGGFEGYMIDKNGIGTMTSFFTTYVAHHRQLAQ